jgi:hypothetical protein
MNQAVHHRLARLALQLGVQRGSHRKTAFIELVLTIAFGDFTADFLSEVVGGVGL